MSSFKNRLNELLKEHNLNEKTLAEILQIKNLSTIYNWTSGNFMPKIDIIAKLSNTFSCSIDYLLGLNDNNDILPPKECPPFHIQLEKILKDKNLTKYTLRKHNILSAGLSSSIFIKHCIPPIPKISFLI